MKRSQSLELRRSEIRQELGTLADKPEMRAEDHEKITSLTKELTDLEAQYRAAVHAEDEEASTRAGAAGEGGERSQIMAESRMANFLSAAANGQRVEGREKELAEAYGLPEGMFPVSMLATPEARQDVLTAAPTTGLPSMQDTIKPRVFSRGDAAFLGVRMPTVGVGEASYPVFATGATGETKARNVIKETEAATFEANILKPSRLTAGYKFNIEDMAVFQGYEAALRADLSEVMSTALDGVIINGKNTGGEPAGLLLTPSGPLTVPGDPTAVNSNYEGLVDGYATGVDGKYAYGIESISMLINSATYQRMVNQYRTTDSEPSAVDWARANTMGLRVSAHIPAAHANTCLLYTSPRPRD